MAKRLFDTEKWERPWYRQLPPNYKLLWDFILSKCDSAGVWYVDMDLARFFIGAKIEIDEAIRLFDKQLEIKGDRWLIKDFIQFQYGTVNEHNKMFTSIQPKLKAFHDAPSIPHPYCIDTDKVKVKDIFSLKTSNKESNQLKENGFEVFWKAYPRKVNKKLARRAWDGVNPDQILLSQILKAIETQKKSDQWFKDDGKFIPHPSTWLNGQRWLDELPNRNGSGNRGSHTIFDRIMGKTDERTLEKEPVGGLPDLS